MQLPNQRKYTGWLDVCILLLVLGSLFFILLGTRPLFIPEEGRYAEIAREMVASGDYITPHLNDIKYFEKPILFYWLTSLAIKVGGLNLWSIRSVNALLGLFGCLLTYFTAGKLYGRLTGLLAALILGTSCLYFVMVHMISLDLALTYFVTASLFTFLLGSQHVCSSVRLFYFINTAIFAALAVLTKGLIGIVFPVLIMSLWIILVKETRILNLKQLIFCAVVFFIIATPWHFWVGLKNPEFFYFYFVEQHFLRYLIAEIGHSEPLWFFIPTILVGFFPWSVFFPQAFVTSLSAFWNKKEGYKIELFFILWVLIVFAFFSFSKSKLIPYILPIFPPLAILTAHYLTKSYQQNLKIKFNYFILLVVAVSISLGLFFFTHFITVFNPGIAKIYFRLGAMILLIGTSLSCVYAYKNTFISILTIVGTSYLFLLVMLASLPFIDTRSTLPLVRVLEPLLQSEDEVITFNQYYQDLPFYLRRRVAILNWRNELTFGMQHQKAHDWLIDDYTFWQYWHSNRRLFVIMDKKNYQLLKYNFPNENIILLGKTITNVVVTNHLKS